MSAQNATITVSGGSRREARGPGPPLKRSLHYHNFNVNPFKTNNKLKLRINLKDIFNNGTTEASRVVDSGKTDTQGKCSSGRSVVVLQKDYFYFITGPFDRPAEGTVRG